jgi:hypothetical protein
MSKRPSPSPRLPLLLCLVAAATLSGGCLFSKKSAAPKETTTLSGETEDSLRQRWVERRAAELVAQGVAPETARAQAAAEFREKYSFTGAAKK